MAAFVVNQSSSMPSIARFRITSTRHIDSQSLHPGQPLPPPGLIKTRGRHLKLADTDYELCENLGNLIRMDNFEINRPSRHVGLWRVADESLSHPLSHNE
jgi:hypothetical protein